MTRNLPRFTIILLCLLSWAQPASATPLTVAGATDYWFTIHEPVNFTADTDAIQFGIDSMLWLYHQSDGIDTLVAENDDWYGLNSHLDVMLQPGSYRLRAGVCCGNPDRWYGESYLLTTNLTPADLPSTTTTTTVSTLPETTTTEVTTTWVPSTTSISPETTTTTTAPPETAPATTTTSTTTPPPTSSTSTSDAPPTTAPIPTAPPETAPAPTAPPTTGTTLPTSTQPPTVSSTSAPATTTLPTTVPEPDTTTLPDPSISPSDSLPTPETTEAPTDPLEALTDTITADEAETLAADPEALAEATPEQAADIFAAIDPGELSDEEAAAIVAAVQTAPPEVRAAFENEINVFDGKFDTYVPLGSAISVGARRTFTAGAVTLGAVPVTPQRRKK